ncbi:MAG: hypothetical protein JWQ95_6997 [Sphaerisporangium sp.]|nr:hypothetical protein [Sphaerisporangium sp.]
MKIYWIRIVRLVPAIVLLPCGPLLTTACVWGDRHLEAGADAVRQVQEIGVLKVDVKSDFTEADVLVTSRYMIFDFGVARAEDALRKGADYLRARGWKVQVDRFPGSMYLISDRLEATVLLQSLEQAFTMGVNEEVKKAAKDARVKAGDPALLFLSLKALR